MKDIVQEEGPRSAVENKDIDLLRLSTIEVYPVLRWICLHPSRLTCGPAIGPEAMLERQKMASNFD